MCINSIVFQQNLRYVQFKKPHVVGALVLYDHINPGNLTSSRGDTCILQIINVNLIQP